MHWVNAGLWTGYVGECAASISRPLPRRVPGLDTVAFEAEDSDVLVAREFLLVTVLVTVWIDTEWYQVT
ncbi:hypothetical protein ACFQER_11565 [Halomicroarcula sp. GCM10025894]|uniref:hypothetical protein n=1 Tax=Halomicroarcula sp. GCM10025894 TaxID=3252673 RepID=UPI00361D02DC